jgi:four helix bundle protein
VEAASFQQLDVYRRIAALADQLHRTVWEWAPLDRWALGVQLIRAADSVGANIAEGDGRFGHADQKRFLFIARGSACELQHWIARAAARNLRLPANSSKEAREVTRMLNGLIRTLPSH